MGIDLIVKHRALLLATAFFLVGGILAAKGSFEVRKTFERAFIAKVSAAILSANVRVREINLKNREAKLVFVGDVMLSRAVGRRIEKEKDSRYPFLKIADALRTADLAFGNLEGPISARGKDQGSIYSFRAGLVIQPYSNLF